jgi:hypothetical protein
MADDDKSSGISAMIMPAVLGLAVGGGGTAGVTSALNGEETVVNTATIESCQVFIDHARKHMFMENELKHLRERIK